LRPQGYYSGMAGGCGARGCPIEAWLGAAFHTAMRLVPGRGPLGTLAAFRRGLVPAALSFCKQFAVFEVPVQRLDAETTQSSKDSSHIFDDCTHDFLFARVVT